MRRYVVEHGALRLAIDVPTEKYEQAQMNVLFRTPTHSSSELRVSGPSAHEFVLALRDALNRVLEKRKQ